jgi:hypothetical protein
MKSEERRKDDRRLLLIFGGGAILILLYYFVFVTPRGMIYRHKLKSLRVEHVRSLQLHTEKLVDGKVVTVERILQRDDIAMFLALVSEATSYHAHHPRGGWTCFVDIDTTTDIRRFSFLIHSTSNNGVYFDLYSSPSGLDGWSYGTLRNDALGPFIETLFRNESKEMPNKSQPTQVGVSVPLSRFNPPSLSLVRSVTPRV